ncbi:MAG: hypothetical protein ACE5DX_02775 [Candidatus Dojkabacteria bacterium]
MSKLTIKSFKSSAEKIFADRALLLHIVVVAGFCLSFIVFTYIYRLPSIKYDAQGYLNTATNLIDYKKGGAFVVLLAPFINTGFESYWAALSINLPSWILIGFTFWIPSKYGIDKRIQLLATLLLIPIGFWATGISHVTVTEILHIALILFGVTQLFSYFYFKTKFALIFSVFSLGLGLSTRLQSWPAFFIVTLLTGVLYLRTKRAGINKQAIILAKLFIAMVIVLTSSFLIETSLREYSRKDDWFKVYGRATIYTGLFSTQCGEFSKTAIVKLRSEIDLTITEIFQKNLSEMGPHKVASVFVCKFNKFFETSGYSFTNMEQVRVEAKIGSPLDARATLLDMAAHIENFLIRSLRFGQFILLIFPALAILGIKEFERFKNKHLLLAIAVLGSYFCLLMLLELSSRYVIPPTIFTTLILLYGNNKLKIPPSKKTLRGR